MGFKIALYLASGFLIASQALQLTDTRLCEAGIGTGGELPMLPFSEMNALMGSPAMHAFENRFGVQLERVA